MKAKWREISMQEAERKQQLQASLEYARPQVGVGLLRLKSSSFVFFCGVAERSSVIGLKF